MRCIRTLRKCDKNRNFVNALDFLGTPWCNTPYKHQSFVNAAACLFDVARRLPSRYTSSDNRRSNINNAAATAAAAATTSTTAATNISATFHSKADIHDGRTMLRFSAHIGSVIVAAAFRAPATCSTSRRISRTQADAKFRYRKLAHMRVPGAVRQQQRASSRTKSHIQDYANVKTSSGLLCQPQLQPTSRIISGPA